VNGAPLTALPEPDTIRRIRRPLLATAVPLASAVAALVAHLALARTAELQPPPVKPAATVDHLMRHLVEPRAATLFAAVGVTIGAHGEIEHAPRTDEQWRALRRDAVMLVESANLLLVPNRRIVADAGRAHLDRMVWRDRDTWNRHVLWLAEAAGWALDAIDQRNAVRLQSHGGDISLACELCHLRYRYPDAVRRLDLPER
jgi:hypothetical protein